MGCNTKVLNQSNGWRIKRSQAINRVEQRLSEWIEFGYSIRDLTSDEIFAARSQQAAVCEGLAYFVEGKEDGELIPKPLMAEIPSCVYRPTERNQAQTREGYQLVKAANQFAEMGA